MSMSVLAIAGNFFLFIEVLEISSTVDSRYLKVKGTF